MRWFFTVLLVCLGVSFTATAQEEVQSGRSVPVGVDCGFLSSLGCTGRSGIAFHRSKLVFATTLEAGMISFQTGNSVIGREENYQEIIPVGAGAWAWYPLTGGDMPVRVHVLAEAGWAFDRWYYQSSLIKTSGFEWQLAAGISYYVFFVGVRYFRFHLPRTTTASVGDPNVAVVMPNVSGAQLSIGFVFDFPTRR